MNGISKGRRRLLKALLAVSAMTALPPWYSALAQDPPSISPTVPWRRLDETTVLERIALGSCLDQTKPQPIWKAVLAERPQLFLMLGDNVYGYGSSADLKELRQAYALQAVQPELALARSTMPFMAVWDDHDFGKNDGGADFPHKQAAAKLFHEFWQTVPEAPAGVYSSRAYGPPAQRVQIIMLDTRTFRSPLKPKTDSFPYWGRYEPDDDQAKTMLGEAQWAWLEQELKRPAQIRILVSSIQVLADGHGFERWGNLPRERARLLKLLDETQATGVILFSGDRHSGAFYKRARPDRYPLVELTSSSLNRPYGPPKDTRMAEQVSKLYHRENFGLVQVDWPAGRVVLALKGLSGESVAEVTLAFEDLGIRR